MLSTPDSAKDGCEDESIPQYIDSFTPISPGVKDLLQNSLLQLAKCIIKARIDDDIKASKFSLRYQSLWPVFTALNKPGPCISDSKMLLLLELLWLANCTHCGKERAVFCANSGSLLSCCEPRRILVYPTAFDLFLQLSKDPSFLGPQNDSYLFLVLNFATQLVLTQLEMGPSAVSIAINRYIAGLLIKDHSWNSSPDFIHFAQVTSQRQKEIMDVVKHSATLEKNFQISAYDALRKKYSLIEFEKSLGLFCISMIPETASYEVSSTVLSGLTDDKQKEDSLMPVPMAWLKEQAGNAGVFSEIASGRHPSISGFISAFNVKSKDVENLLTPHAQPFKENDRTEHNRPAQFSSLMERNETAIKCSWDDNETNVENNEAGPTTILPAPVKEIQKKPVESMLNPRKKRYFSEKEISCLIEGYERFGPKWTLILDSYPFSGRSSVDLKDKIRNLKKAGLLTAVEKQDK